MILNNSWFFKIEKISKKVDIIKTNISRPVFTTLYIIYESSRILEFRCVRCSVSVVFITEVGLLNTRPF